MPSDTPPAYRAVIDHREAIDEDSPGQSAPTHKCIAYIANECLNNNWYRKGNDFHHLDPDELNRMFFSDLEEENLVRAAYCFLDEDGGTAGMIRLECHDGADPRWEFSVDALGKIVYGGS